MNCTEQLLIRLGVRLWSLAVNMLPGITYRIGLVICPLGGGCVGPFGVCTQWTFNLLRFAAKGQGFCPRYAVDVVVSPVPGTRIGRDCALWGGRWGPGLFAEACQKEEEEWRHARPRRPVRQDRVQLSTRRSRNQGEIIYIGTSR